MKRPAPAKGNRAGAGGRRRNGSTDRRRAGAAARFQQPDSVTVKSRVDPASFYACELNAPVPAGTGWRVLKALCPFHADRSPGSFAIHTTSGAYRCYSCGAAGTDAIDYAMKRHALTFREALVYLERGW